MAGNDAGLIAHCFWSRQNPLFLWVKSEDPSEVGNLTYIPGASFSIPTKTPFLFRQILIWCLQNNVCFQAAVRRSTVFALSRILVVLPKNILLSEFQTELVDMLKWLLDVNLTDPDHECREIAKLCLLSLKETLQTEALI
jgi:hypothetical protein